MPGARNVTKGATSVTAVAPKFSDALTLFQPGGRFYPSSRPVVPGCAGCAMILADQLTLFQPGGS